MFCETCMYKVIGLSLRTKEFSQNVSSILLLTTENRIDLLESYHSQRVIHSIS